MKSNCYGNKVEGKKKTFKNNILLLHKNISMELEGATAYGR